MAAFNLQYNTMGTWNSINFIIIVVIISCIICPTVFGAIPVEINDLLTPDDSSTPPCPSNGQGTFLRYKGDGKCYQANTQGPCNRNMVLYPHPASKKFGFCDCFDARSDTKQEATFLNNRNLSHCIPEIRGQVFVPERQRCYSVFDQGPCPEGKWLVLNGSFYPVCADNTCLDFPLNSQNQAKPNSLAHNFVFTISAKGECYQTMTKGYCAKSYELRFSANHFIPQCRYIPSKKIKCPTMVPEIRKLRCKPGSRYDFISKCSRSINPRK